MPEQRARRFAGAMGSAKRPCIVGSRMRDKTLGPETLIDRSPEISAVIKKLLAPHYKYAAAFEEI